MNFRAIHSMISPHIYTHSFTHTVLTYTHIHSLTRISHGHIYLLEMMTM